MLNFGGVCSLPPSPNDNKIGIFVATVSTAFWQRLNQVSSNYHHWNRCDFKIFKCIFAKQVDFYFHPNKWDYDFNLSTRDLRSQVPGWESHDRETSHVGKFDFIGG